jgi:hypothetical protein
MTTDEIATAAKNRVNALHDFRNVLSDESMRSWKLVPNPKVSDQLAWAGKCVVGDRNGAELCWRIPPSVVAAATMHKFGRPATKKSVDKYTPRRKYTVLLDLMPGEEWDLKSPKIRVDAAAYMERKTAMHEKFAQLFLRDCEPVKKAELDGEVRNRSASVMLNKRRDLQTATTQEDKMAIEAKYKAQMDAIAASDEVREAAQMQVENRMQSWRYKGDDATGREPDFPVDCKERCKLQIAVATGGQDMAIDMSGFAGAGAMDLGLALGGGDDDGTFDWEDDDRHDFTDDEARYFGRALQKSKHFLRRFKHVWGDGTPIDWSTTTVKKPDGRYVTYDNNTDPCFRAVRKNDVIEFLCTPWFYVLSAGTYGVSLNISPVICHTFPRDEDASAGVAGSAYAEASKKVEYKPVGAFDAHEMQKEDQRIARQVQQQQMLDPNAYAQQQQQQQQYAPPQQQYAPPPPEQQYAPPPPPEQQYAPPPPPEQQYAPPPQQQYAPPLPQQQQQYAPPQQQQPPPQQQQAPPAASPPPLPPPPPAQQEPQVEGFNWGEHQDGKRTRDDENQGGRDQKAARPDAV